MILDLFGVLLRRSEHEGINRWPKVRGARKPSALVGGSSASAEVRWQELRAAGPE